MAATTIDDLQIKIEADAKTASDKLDALAQSMVKLASSLSINVGKMSGVAIGLNSITRASQNLNSRNITTLATAMGKVAGVDSAQISRVAGSMTQLKNSVSGGFNTDMTGIVNVANSLSKLGGTKATQGAQNLVLIKDQLAQFVQGMNSVGTFTFDPTGLTNTIKAIAKLGGKTATQAMANLPSISAQLQNFVRQMNQIGSMSFDNKNLTDLVTSIGRLGSVASGRAVNNIPLLANNLKYLFETLSKAPYISQNIIQMTTALANLARTGASSGTAARSLGTSLFSFSKSAGNARKSAFSLAGAIGKFYATYWMVIRGLGLFRDAIDISSDLTEVENVVRTTFGNMEYKVNDFVQNSIQQFGMSELSVKQYASTFQAMGTAMDVGGKQIEKANSFLSGATDGYVGLSDSMSDVSLNLTKLTADMASFYDKDQADVAKDLQSVFTGMVVPLRKYGLDLTQATLKEWAMKNGMDADIKSMTQAEKAMLRYQYVLANTTAAQGDFSRTADTWANQVRILKQNFQQLGGIIGGALINAFKPFLRTLNFVMQKVISFATTVTNALGAIFGWKFEVSGGGVVDDWSDAASSADDLADSTGKAADNTKKMKNNLHALDELNINNGYDNGTGSGGSGSGAGGAGGGAGSGGLVKTDTIWKDFESNIKDLYQLGEYIRDALIGAMESIDWDSVYEKARNFGTGLAEFLNGLFAGSNGITLFGEVGKTIASALNTVVYAALSFGKEFNFEQFGYNIADGINNFFATFDFAALAETLNTWANGILKVASESITNIDWKKVFEGVGNVVFNLDASAIVEVALLSLTWKNKTQILKTAGTTLLNIFTGGITLTKVLVSLKKISFALPGTPAFDVVATSILDTIGECIKNLIPDWANRALSRIGAGLVAGAVGGSWFPGVGTIAGAIIGAITGAISAIEIDGQGILKIIFDKIFNFDLTSSMFDSARENFAKGGINIVLGIIDGIAGVLDFVVEPIADLFTCVWDALCNVFGIHSPAETMKPIGRYIVLGIIEGLSNTIDEFIGTLENFASRSIAYLNEKVPEIISSISIFFREDLPQNIKEAFDNVMKKFSEWKNNAVLFVTEKVPEIANGIIDAFKNLKDNLFDIGKNAINGLWDGMKNTWDTVKTGISDFVSGITTVFTDGLDIHSPSRVMAEIGGYTIAGFNNGIIENIQTTMNSIHEWISNIEAVLAPEVWANIFNNIIRGFQYKWLEFRTFWNSSLNAWWNANVTPWFAVAKWTALGNNMKNGLYYGFKGIVQMIGSVMNGMIDVFNAGLSRIKNAMNSLISDYNSVAGELGVSKLSHVNVATISKINIPKYEVGGFPEDGLFFANHNEMVGQFSNGKTAVANNEQIVAGIREGVKAAVSEILAPYLSDIADSNREIAEKDASFTVDGRELVKAINERESRNGFSFT
jgi:phage-related protein